LVQIDGFLVQMPPASVPPQSDLNAQYEPDVHSPSIPRVPHFLPSAIVTGGGPSAVHAPACNSDTPTFAAMQGLL
jgi:hypothetical protein